MNTKIKVKALRTKLGYEMLQEELYCFLTVFKARNL